MNNLICGDCLVEMRNIKSDSVDMVITDPPYGIDYQSRRSKSGLKNKIANDRTPFIWWIREAFRVVKNWGGAALL